MSPKIILIVALTFSPLVQTGCQNPPSERVVAVQTLAAIGMTAKASLDEAARLLARGEITVDQWSKVARFYDQTFAPAYTLAVASVKADLSSIASPDLVGLAAQLATLVAQLTAKPPTP